MIDAALIALSFLGGVMLGRIIEARAWIKNATDYRRIERFGRIYKVSTQ